VVVAPEVRRLYRSEEIEITEEQGRRVIRVRRSPMPLDLALLTLVEEAFVRVVPLPMRKRVALLLDARDAPLIPSDGYERDLGAAAPRLFDGFAKRAVLVRTAVGKLQAQRVSRARAQPFSVFEDEAEAIAYLLDADDAPPSTRSGRKSWT
jgi:hypothetical protein